MMNILLSTGRKVSRTPRISQRQPTKDVRSYLGKRIHHFAKCCSPNFPIAYLPPAFSRSRDSGRLSKDRSPPSLRSLFARERTFRTARHDVAGQIESSRRKTRRNSISISCAPSSETFDACDSFGDGRADTLRSPRRIKLIPIDRVHRIPVYLCAAAIRKTFVRFLSVVGLWEESTESSRTEPIAKVIIELSIEARYSRGIKSKGELPSSIRTPRIFNLRFVPQFKGHLLCAEKASVVFTRGDMSVGERFHKAG